MKVILEFTLPEEQAELDLTVQAPALRDALDDLREYLCGKVKYDDPDTRPGLREVYERFFTICYEHGVSPWGED